MVELKDSFKFIESLVNSKSVKQFKDRFTKDNKHHIKFIIEIICNFDSLELTKTELKSRKNYLPLEKYFKNKTELDMKSVVKFLLNKHKPLRELLSTFLHHIYDSAVLDTCDC